MNRKGMYTQNFTRFIPKKFIILLPIIYLLLLGFTYILLDSPLDQCSGGFFLICVGPITMIFAILAGVPSGLLLKDNFLLIIICQTILVALIGLIIDLVNKGLSKLGITWDD